MTGGLIQLASYGIQDLYITGDPQITLFKVVYRRHTNFSVEPIPQKFTYTPNFGKKATCLLSKAGDLVSQIYVIVTIPTIRLIGQDNITQFAWVRKLGYALIKSVEIEIGGHVIDKQYGEWLGIWNELFVKHTDGLDNMIGNIPYLYNFSKNKDQYTLYIPLQFWFCRNNGVSLPMISLQYTDVKITVEFNDFESCHLISPTYYINTYQDVVNLKPFEYIEQNINGVIASGLFVNFDPLTKRLYYMKISNQNFQSVTYTSVNLIDLSDQVFNPKNAKYNIKGIESGFQVMPEFNKSVNAYQSNTVENSDIIDAYLLVDYIYIDDDERAQFLRAKHDYLFDQVILINEKTIESPNKLVKIDLLNPCKFMVWVAQFSYLANLNNNDFFNYTDSYQYVHGKQVGKSLVVGETILLNNQPRLSMREYQYFNYIQEHQHAKYEPSEGINMYSFGIYPNKLQPSGSCNMSQIDNIQININLSYKVTIGSPVKFRGYALVMNVLRIVNGLASPVFSK